MIEARKITFQEAWDSSVIFFVDEELEQEIEAQIDSLLVTAGDARVSETATITVESITDFLMQQENGLEVILKDIQLSEEKFMRMISLLRKLGRIPGQFDTEWSVSSIKRRIAHVSGFAQLVANLLVDGRNDQELQQYIPRYYLDTLNYRGIKGGSEAARRIRYKSQLIGTYGARKGHRVEELIHQHLARIESEHAISFGKGRSSLIDTDIDFAVPGVGDPWIIIMSSFQETTSSGQTTKARDMLSAYERIVRHNSRYGEGRVFVNFVDGGGWLARRRDLERLVEHSHYFLNLAHLDMLESIVLKHIPRR